MDNIKTLVMVINRGYFSFILVLISYNIYFSTASIEISIRAFYWRAYQDRLRLCPRAKNAETSAITVTTVVAMKVYFSAS